MKPDDRASEQAGEGASGVIQGRQSPRTTTTAVAAAAAHHLSAAVSDVAAVDGYKRTDFAESFLGVTSWQKLPSLFIEFFAGAPRRPLKGVVRRSPSATHSQAARASRRHRVGLKLQTMSIGDINVSTH